MKSILFLSVMLIATSAWPSCKIDLLKATGKYLVELEKAELRRYQNNFVCEVLDRELEGCSKIQLAELEKTFNVKEVRGNYCQPHLPPYPTTEKALFLKGADLFSWKEPEGYYWYAIIPGTNRQKTGEEIRSNKMSYSYLKRKLEQLPPGIEINWNNPHTVENEKNSEFSYPSKDVIEKIKIQSAKLNLVLKTPIH